MVKTSAYYEYETQDGDTFDALALDMYNDEKMSHIIAEYNPDYCGTLIFEAGVTLYLPILSDEETKPQYQWEDD